MKTPLLPDPPPRPSLSLRVVLALLTAGGIVYVLLLAVILWTTMGAGSRDVHDEAATALKEFELLDQSGRAFDSIIVLSRIHLERGEVEGAAERLNFFVRNLPSPAAMGTLAALQDLPPEMILDLSRAVEMDSRIRDQLQETAARAVLGQPDSALRSLARVDSLNAVFSAHLVQAQQAGIVDLVQRERALADTHRRGLRLAGMASVMGAFLILFAGYTIGRRLYQPLAELDDALTRVADGELDLELPVVSTDEIGRLAHHFNRMTEVLRAVVEEERDAVRRMTRAFMSSSFDAVITTDLKGVVTEWNQVAEAMFGWNRTDVLGRNLNELIVPEAARANSEDPWRLLREDAAAWTGVRRDFPAVTRTGKALEVEVALVPVAEGGRLERVTAFVRDQTERKEFEDRLRKSQRLDAVGRLAGGVAHDFNNLLTVILGQCDLLEPRLQPDTPDAHAVSVVRLSAERAAKLTNQLLAFARKQMMTPMIVDVRELLTHLDPVLESLATEQTRLTYEFHDRAGAVDVDPSQLEQVIMNLVLNAREALFDRPDGRIVVRVSSARFEDDDKGLVVIQVADNGRGMEPAESERVFEPFYTTKDLGSGLGLATVYGIVKQAGGDISVESTRGEGTTFTISLPRASGAPARQAEANATSPVEPAASQGGSILLVEDQEALAGVVAEILEVRGYRTHWCSTAESALEWLAAEEPVVDILVTDVVLPGMDGRRLAERIHGEYRPDLPVLFISGYAEGMVEGRDTVREGTAFLAKPFSTARLVREIERLLRSRPA